MSIKEVRKSKADSTWLSHKLYYRNTLGKKDSIKVDLKSRGNFRLNECYLPPLWIKIPKKRAAGTLFQGNKKVKLVLPCNNQSGSNDLILREYICYKLCELITPFAFKTRLVNIDLTELRGKKDKNFQVKGIMIEDLEKVAKHFNAREAKDVKIYPSGLEDTSALRFYFFQVLISNTDWSETQQHNTKLIQLRRGNYVAMPYDFDMSGVVDAPYSVVSEINGIKLPIENVKERLYRGFCKSPVLTEFVRKEILSKEDKLLSVPDLLKGELSDNEISSIKDYLKDFFEVLKNDNSFKKNILDQCRSAN